MTEHYTHFARHMKVHDVSLCTTLSKSTLWMLEKLGAFPTSIPLYGRAKVWSRSDVEDWVKGRISARDRNYHYTYNYKVKEHESLPPCLLSTIQLATDYRLPRSSVYELMKTEGFPKQIELTERRVAWVESEVLDWIASRKTTLKAS